MLGATVKPIIDYKLTIYSDCEYWESIELMLALEYKRWDKFCNVIENAKIVCERSNYIIADHFSKWKEWLMLALKHQEIL